MLCVFDTNVLVYAATSDEPLKTARAEEVLTRAKESRTGVLPAQVLAEFTNTALRRDSPFSHDDIARIVKGWASVFWILPLTEHLVLTALRGVRDYQFSYYDAQIWAAAKLNQVPVVLSEDFSDGAAIEGVTFINPFAEHFDPHAL